jgi:hypothetical protein
LEAKQSPAILRNVTADYAFGSNPRPTSCDGAVREEGHGSNGAISKTMDSRSPAIALRVQCH